MTTLDEHVLARLRDVLARMGLDASTARVTRCPHPDMGDVAVEAALGAGRTLRRAPMEIAREIADALKDLPVVSRCEPVRPGFVNLTYSDTSVTDAFVAMCADPALGVVRGVPVRTLLDFGGPNVAKPLHVGHLRSLVIGESLRRILSETGQPVVSDVHLGDWGLQMGMLLSQLRREGIAAATADVDTLERAYKAAAAVCRSDPSRLEEARRTTASLQAGDVPSRREWEAVRRTSVDAVRVETEALGASFDRWYGESDSHSSTGAMLEDLSSRGISRRDDGATVVDVGTGKPPYLLQKSDGASLYATTDLAALKDRVDEGFARVVYVVDARQALHFESLFDVARRAGYARDVELVHVGFGTVDGPDGRPLKTREGDAVRLSSLIKEASTRARSRSSSSAHVDDPDLETTARRLAYGAVKFADLSTPRSSGYVFDPDRALAPEGRTGPYAQYAVARLASMADKARAQGLVPGPLALEDPAERQLAMACLSYPAAVAKAAKTYSPHHVAEAVYEVAQCLARFYAACPVLSAPTGQAASRLTLCSGASSVLVRGLRLLGIEGPTRM